MSRCKEFYDKWEKEPNWCEKCPSAVSQINSYLELVTTLEQKGIKKEFTNVNLPEGAARPLFRERDAVVREKAIESVKKCLESGKNPSGQFSKKLTTHDVQKIIHEVKEREPTTWKPTVYTEEHPDPDHCGCTPLKPLEDHQKRCTYCGRGIYDITIDKWEIDYE